MFLADIYTCKGQTNTFVVVAAGQSPPQGATECCKEGVGKIFKRGVELDGPPLIAIDEKAAKAGIAAKGYYCAKTKTTWTEQVMPIPKKTK